jgi:purine nucleosidase
LTIRIHLDTDIGGDADDLCALALLLGEPEVELVGVTTCTAGDGTRAAFVRHVLRLAGRPEIPVASGAFGFLSGVPHKPETQDERYWPGVARSDDSPPGAAVDLIIGNAASGATLVGIGPYTNLAVAETLRPGTLSSTSVVLMGGLLGAIPAGLPQWGPDVDYNVQADRVAARIVFEFSNPLVVPVNVTVQTWLRGADIPVLRSGGPLANLIATQAELQGAADWNASLVRENAGLPRDLLNFHHDPLACAAAVGWDGVDVSDALLSVTFEGDDLVLRESAGGRPARVATAVDAAAFSARWLECVRPL